VNPLDGALDAEHEISSSLLQELEAFEPEMHLSSLDMSYPPLSVKVSKSHTGHDIARFNIARLRHSKAEL
jgi:hypothetical protein